jgi:hypothetical protein
MSNNAVSTMINGWPDALNCGFGDRPDSIFYISSKGIDGTYYRLILVVETRLVQFNDSGHFMSRSGYNNSNFGCKDKTIQMLYNPKNSYCMIN